MTRKRSSPMGLEIYLPVLLAFMMLPLLTQAAPLQDYTEIQQYTEGCYYNYNHYNEGDRIMTNEPCLNCTCHNKMLMCYLRVCPFTKPIGHDCIVEKREDQCCPIITCPEVPVDVAHIAPVSGTELSFPEKFGCSIDGKFYLEGAQVPSNPSKPCELCYCIKNRTSCLMQECTLHIDGCTPIYNKGSCCPVRYNCDHENDVLELEDHSTTTEAATTTTTERPTTGFILTSTMPPSTSTHCIYNGESYADGARIAGETACENCYCMRGDIICAVRECQMPMLNSNGKSCRALPAAEGECCPSNYVCDDDTATTQIVEFGEDDKFTTAAPVKDLHSGIPEEDLQLQTHIDDEETATKPPLHEVKTEDKKATEAEILSRPTQQSVIADEEQDKLEDIEHKSITKGTDETEITTASLPKERPIESEEIVTAAPISTDDLSEFTTEMYGITEDVKKTTETMMDAVTKTPATKDVEHIEDDITLEDVATNVPSGSDKLAEISTDSTISSEEYTTEANVENKPDIEENVTKMTALTTEEILGVTTESDGNKQKPLVSVTEASDTEEDKSIESTTETDDKVDTEAPVTDVEDHKKDEIGTEINFAFEHTTAAIEKLSEDFSSKVSQHEDQNTTTAPITISESTELSRQEIEEHYFTTFSPDNATSELSSVEEYKPEKIENDKQEALTEYPIIAEEKKPLDKTKVAEKKSTKISVELDDKTETAISISSEDEQLTTTSTPEVEVATSSSGVRIEAPSSIVSPEEDIEGSAEIYEKEASGERKPVSTDEMQIDTKTNDPTAEHTTVYPEELGSGYYDAEISNEETSKTPYLSPTIEGVTVVPQSQEQEKDYITTKPLLIIENKTEEPEINAERFKKPGESVEDKKVFDITTSNPTTVFDGTTIEESKNYDDELDVTTSQPFVIDIKISTDETGKDWQTAKIPVEKEFPSSTAVPEKTSDEDETQEYVSKDQVDITTMVTTSDGNLPTKEQGPVDKRKDELLQENEAIETTTSKGVDESYADDSREENKIKPEIEEESTGATTTQNAEESVEQTTSPEKVDSVTDKQYHEKIIPETIDHVFDKQMDITDSPIVIIQDISTTAQPTTEESIKTEPESEAEQEQAGKVDSEEKSTTITTVPIVEQTNLGEIPVMQLPSVIPGEGNCLVGQKTYENNTLVPTSDECEVICKCVSSIVTCERIKCDIPDNVEKCVLDVSSSNKCCPTFACGIDMLSSKTEDRTEPDEKLQYTTISAPHKLSEEHTPEEIDADKSEISTTKPVSVSGDSISGFTIPEIEMPVLSTEEPMSHVKDEDEFDDKKTAKYPTITEEKIDTTFESEASTTPNVPAVEDIVFPQSTPTDGILDATQQQVVNEMIPFQTTNIEVKPELSVGQQKPEEENVKQTTIAHELIESVTYPDVHIPSKVDGIKVENTTPVIHPSDSQDKTKEPETQNIVPTTPPEEETATVEKISGGLEPDNATPPVFSSEEPKEPETQTLSPSVSEEVKDTFKQSEEEPTHLTTVSYDKEPAQESTTEIEFGTDHDPLHSVPSSTETAEAETQTSIPFVVSEDKKHIQTEDAHTMSPIGLHDKEPSQKSETEILPSVSSPEEIKETVTQASIASVSTEEEENISEHEHKILSTVPYENDPFQELETEPSHPLATDEVSTLAPSPENDSAETAIPLDEEQKYTSQEIESTTPTKGTEVPSVQTESEQKLSTAEVQSKDHVPEIEEWDVIRTTTLPSIEDSVEHDFTTTKQSSEESKDYNASSGNIDQSTTPSVKEPESSSTISSITEKAKDITIAPQPFNELGSPATEKENEEEDLFTTALPGFDNENEHTIAPTKLEDKKTNESTEEIKLVEQKIGSIFSSPETGDEIPVESLDNTNMEGTVSSTEHETQTPEVFDTQDFTSATTDRTKPETQTSIPLAPEKSQTTISEETPAHVVEVTDIATKEPISFETKIDNSSSGLSINELYSEVTTGDFNKELSTTIASLLENTDGYKQNAEDHTFSPTESEEEIDTTGLSVEKAHTVPSLARDGAITKSPTAIDENAEEEDIKYTTTVPFTSNEPTFEEGMKQDISETDKHKPASSIDDSSMVSSISTTAPVKQPTIDLLEEPEGASVESEEEISTDPNKIHHIGEFVTERVDGETSSPPVQPVKEIFGEEFEGMQQVTKTPLVELESAGITTHQSEEEDITKVPITAVDIEHVQQPESKYGTTDTTQQFITTPKPPQPENVSTVENINTEQSGEKDIESTTAIKPTQEDEISEAAISHISSKDIEHTSNKQTEEEDSKDIEPITQYHDLAEEIDITTSKPAEDVTKDLKPWGETDTTTTKFLDHTDEIPDDIVTQVPTTNGKEESEDVYKIEEKITQSPAISEYEKSEATTSKLLDLADHVSEVPVKGIEFEKDSHEDVSEIPTDGEVSTNKLHELLEQSTEQPKSEGSSEIPIDGLHELTEQSSDLPETEEGKTAKVPMVAEVSTEGLPERITESPIIDVELDEESNEKATELSIDDHTSTEKLPEIAERVPEVPFKDYESEAESQEDATEHSIGATDKLPEEDESIDQATKLPAEVSITTDKLHEHATKASIEDTESETPSTKEATELPVTAKVLTDNIPEDSTKLSIKEVDSEGESQQQTTDATDAVEKLPSEIVDSYEQATEMPTDYHVPTDKLSEQVTEKPTKDISLEEVEEETDKYTAKPHLAAEESTYELPEKNTEPPVSDVKSETESLEEVASATTERTRSEDGIQKQTTISPTVVEESTFKLPEYLTELPSKNIELEAVSHEESELVSTEKISELGANVTELPAVDAESDEKEATKSPVVFNDVSTLLQTFEQTTTSSNKAEEEDERTTENISSAKLQPATTKHPLFSHHTTLPSVSFDVRIDDTSSHSPPASAKDEEVFTIPPTTTVTSTTPEPATTSAPHYQPPPPIYGQPPQYGPTQYEDEYTDEDEGEVFGPGTCRYGGKLYVSAQQIPRDDPCDFCFCFRSDIICLQQSCPPPIAGCHEEPISGFCCPRYECPVSMATVFNMTTSTTTTSTTLPPHFLHHSYGNNAQRNGCLINGRPYRVGEKIESTSGPCINCTCGGDGKMKCDPQACIPEPTMQHVMAVVAAGRKR